MALNFEQILDKFHCLRNILHVFNYQSLKRDLVQPYAIQFNQYKKELYFRIYKNLISNNFEKVYEILQYSVHIFNDEPKKKSVMRLKNYIRKHQKHIENWGLFPFNPTMTETFIKSVIKYRFGSVGRVFSYAVFVKLLALNCSVFEWI